VDRKQGKGGNLVRGSKEVDYAGTGVDPLGGKSAQERNSSRGHLKERYEDGSVPGATIGNIGHPRPVAGINHRQRRELKDTS